MKKICSYLLCAVSIPMISADICNAQATSSTALALKIPSTAVVIDGTSKEWGDSLSYYNAEKKIHYAIANDKTTLYLVVKTQDPVQIGDIMHAGLTFSVDTKGRKRSSFSTTFPYTESGSTAMAGAGPGAAVDQTQQQKVAMALLTRFKKIKVDGFKDISEDDLGTTNLYNIQTAIGYDADGSLVYEEAIPLGLFHAGDLAKGEWAFNIKMNGIDASVGQPSTGDVSGGAVGANPGGKGSRGGGLSGSNSSKQGTANISALQSQKSTPTIDFWGKFTLAQ